MDAHVFTDDHGDRIVYAYLHFHTVDGRAVAHTHYLADNDSYFDRTGTQPVPRCSNLDAHADSDPDIRADAGAATVRANGLPAGE